jgi:hypothetical protein
VPPPPAGRPSEAAAPPVPARALAGIGRLLALLLVLAAAAETLVSRGAGYLREERVRAGLRALEDGRRAVAPYMTMFAALLAVATIAALGLRLALLRLPPAARGLVLGVATTMVALGLTSIFVPPGVQGIITVHLAVSVGGLVLAIVVLAAPLPGELKLIAALPQVLPPLGAAAVVVRGGVEAEIARAALWGVTGAVAAGVAALALYSLRRAPRLVQLGVLAVAMIAGCAAAGVALARPTRVAEFVLFSHGMAADFRGALAMTAALGLAVALAAGALIASGKERPLLGHGVLLVALGGPCPICAPQSLFLGAGLLALATGALAELPEEIVDGSVVIDDEGEGESDGPDVPPA